MTKLETINTEDLQNRTYELTHFLIDELIPEGLHILAGAPKIGKSWLALWLCLCVAQGQPLWGFATAQGEVLYLSLEDSFQRMIGWFAISPCKRKYQSCIMRTPMPDGFIQPESANKFAQILDALDPPTCSLNSILKDISYKRMEGVVK